MLASTADVIEILYGDGGVSYVVAHSGLPAILWLCLRINNLAVGTGSLAVSKQVDRPVGETMLLSADLLSLITLTS